jgi:hypothetical protein
MTSLPHRGIQTLKTVTPMGLDGRPVADVLPAPTALPTKSGLQDSPTLLLKAHLDTAMCGFLLFSGSNMISLPYCFDLDDN